MSTQDVPIVPLLKEIMQRRKRLPSQLAADLGISHATVSRWLSGADVPNVKSRLLWVHHSLISLYPFYQLA